MHWELNPDTVTYPSTNRAQYRLTLLMETNAPPVRQTTTRWIIIHRSLVSIQLLTKSSSSSTGSLLSTFLYVDHFSGIFVGHHIPLQLLSIHCELADVILKRCCKLLSFFTI